MKLKDVLSREVDVDCGNDVLDIEMPAFCGPIGLTDAGKTEWADVLELDIEINDAETFMEINCNDSEKLAKRSNKFLWAAAGYVSEELWDKWFFWPDEEGDE